MPTTNVVANEDGSYTVTVTVPAPAIQAAPTEAQVQGAVDAAVEQEFAPPAPPATE